MGPTGATESSIPISEVGLEFRIDLQGLVNFDEARGLAVPMEIEMGLAMAPRHGGRLGDALVRQDAGNFIEVSFAAVVAG